MRIVLKLSLALALAGCASAPKVKTEGDKLNAIVAQYTDGQKHLDPFHAPYFNLEEDYGKFGDYASKEYFERDKAVLRTAVESLKSIDAAKLNTDEQRTYALFKGQAEKELEAYDYPVQYLDFNQMSNRAKNYIDSSNPKLTSFPFDSVKHYDAYIARAKGFGAYVDREIALQREAVQKGITQNCQVVGKIPNSFKDALEPDAEKNPFYRPVLNFPDSIKDSERNRLRSAFATMVRQDIVPHMERLDRFVRQEYAPHCRKTYGIGGLPNGDRFYAYSIRARADLALSPNDLHKLGLSEVARIEKEMTEVRKQLGFKGSRAQFIKVTATDPKYFYGSAKEMFDAFVAVKAKVKPKLENYFSLIPKSDFDIVDSGNPEDAAGSYHSPTETKPIGRFVVNTKNLRSVPRATTTTLLLHEAIPGHHFQLALQFEQKDRLSEFQRKLFHSNAFTEGWALYAEYLGREMGMYEDPLQKLGNLNDEMLRAVRLVVDTGIHNKGWDQKKAVKYMADHLNDDPRQIEIEANRYSVWPGQALAYKVGQLKIIDLRKLAEKELGPKFDIKEFHKQVIGDGTLSLSVLEEKIKEWIVKVRG